MKIIAHRSGPTVYPEQTVISALLALKNGADIVEIDTRFTADGQIAVSHDADAERVFGVSKNISEMTTREFLSLRHKNSPAFASHLLTDYMKSGVAPLLIHVKEGGERMLPLLETINEYSYEDKVILGVTAPEDAVTVKKFNSDIKVLAFMPNPGYIEEFSKAGVEYMRLWEKWMSDENVAAVLNTGKKLWIMAGMGENVGYTNSENLSKWEALGADAVLVNDVLIK